MLGSKLCQQNVKTVLCSRETARRRVGLVEIIVLDNVSEETVSRCEIWGSCVDQNLDCSDGVSGLDEFGLEEGIEGVEACNVGGKGLDVRDEGIDVTVHVLVVGITSVVVDKGLKSSIGVGQRVYVGCSGGQVTNVYIIGVRICLTSACQEIEVLVDTRSIASGVVDSVREGGLLGLKGIKLGIDVASLRPGVDFGSQRGKSHSQVVSSGPKSINIVSEASDSGRLA